MAGDVGGVDTGGFCCCSHAACDGAGGDVEDPVVGVGVAGFDTGDCLCREIGNWSDCAFAGLVSFGPADSRNVEPVFFWRFYILPTECQKFTAAQGGVMSKGDHGYVDSGALSRLLKVLDASSGLVVSRDVGRVYDACDVSPSQGGCLSRRAPLCGAGSVQPGQQFANSRIVGGVGFGTGAVSVRYRCKVGAYRGWFLLFACQSCKPHLKVLGVRRPC